MQKILENPWIRIPGITALIFIMCIISEYVYHESADLLHGSIIGLAFSLWYAFCESIDLWTPYIKKIFTKPPAR